MSSVVLDASAVLAMFLGEPGKEIVEAKVRGGIISCVNVEEIAARLMKRGDTLEGVSADVRALTLECVPFGDEQAFLTASLMPHCRDLRISQADRACLALALERQLPVLTGDRRWKELDIGVTVELIR